MSEFSDAIDKLMGNAHSILKSFGDEFTFEDFLYSIIQQNQKDYIELLYLCRKNSYPFRDANQGVSRALKTILESTHSVATEGKTIDIFHNPTANYRYSKKK